MAINLEITEVKTCLPTYSWDLGTPLISLVELTTAAVTQKPNNPEEVEYVGYAPFVSISLSSDPGFNRSDDLHGMLRTINFGDFYNSKTNTLRDSTMDLVAFCHVYVMPGVYTITMEQTEYKQVKARDNELYGNCIQKHCINWAWKTFQIEKTEGFPISAVTWKNSKLGNLFEKKWRYEPCVADWWNSRGAYIEKSSINKDVTPLSWQWYNFRKNSVHPNNTATPWFSAGFQKPSEVNWNQTAGPCFNLGYSNSDLIWKWDIINTANVSRWGDDIIWDETKLEEPGNATWDFVRDYCYGESVDFILSSIPQTITKTAVIRVLEIPPTAYIKATLEEDPENNTNWVSPAKVRLTPKFSTSGSFPIERIDWDLGDGTPVISQRRWSPTLEAPFVFSGHFSDDYEDPRNYDIIHTYTRNSNTGFSFYPSITAYASSTGTSDSAACIVGPLKYPNKPNKDFVLLQNELTDHGKVLIGQIDRNTVVWKADK